MDYDSASLRFEQLAMAKGWVTIKTENAIAIQKGDAILRLRPCKAGVILEVTHGPGQGQPVFWLHLYSDPASSESPSFDDCIEFGLELMSPNIKTIS